MAPPKRRRNPRSGDGQREIRRRRSSSLFSRARAQTNTTSLSNFAPLPTTDDGAPAEVLPVHLNAGEKDGSDEVAAGLPAGVADSVGAEAIVSFQEEGIQDPTSHENDDGEVAAVEDPSFMVAGNQRLISVSETLARESRDIAATTTDSSENNLCRNIALQYAQKVSAKNRGSRSARGERTQDADGETRGLPVNEILGFMLKCGGNYLSDLQYEDMRSLVEGTAKGVAQDSRASFVPKAAEDTVHLLHEKGLLPRIYLTSALTHASKIFPSSSSKDQSEFDSLQKDLLSKYSLPSLSTIKRRLLPGGTLEELLLPAVPVLLQRKRNVAKALSAESCDEGESDIVEDLENNNGGAKGPILKAGVILLSSHIQRDMESTTTYNCIMTGVRGSEYWRDSTVAREFCETDLAMFSHSALKPAAYGFEGVSDSDWPDVLCEGCKVDILIRGFRNHRAQTVDSILSPSLQILKGIISGSPFLLKSSTVPESMSPPPIAVSSGDYIVQVQIDTKSGFVHGSNEPMESDNQDRNEFLASLVFRSTTQKRPVTLTFGERLYVVERLKLADSDSARPQNWIPGTLAPHSNCEEEQVSLRTGCWVNDAGETCVKIFIAIFSDDFNLRKQGNHSAGGVYFIYLSMPLENRSGAQSCRVLGITPPDCDSACLVDSLLEDFILSEREGVLCRGPDGNPIRVYTKLSIYVADYSEIGHTGLTMGHSALHPCSVCAVHRGQKGTESFHTARTSSLNLALVRNGPRVDALRKTNPIWKSLGLKDAFLSSSLTELSETTNCLSAESVRRISPVISPILILSKGLGESSFDPFQSFAAGPDHGFFLGIGKDTLSFVFALLPNENSRRDFEGIAVCLLKHIGFQKPNKILSGSPTPQSPLTSLSCSEIAATLSVLPMAMTMFLEATDSWHLQDIPEIQKVVKSALDLIRAVYCSSQRDDIFTEEEMKNLKVRVRGSKKLAETLIDSVRICATSPSSRMRVEIKKMTKPNLHRILEFVTRTLPMVGYEVRHLCELLFEKAHNFVKAHYEQTAVGTNEAWNCLRKFRERELCERLIGAIESKCNSRFPEVDSNAIEKAIADINIKDLVHENRFKSVRKRMKASGARGLFVSRGPLIWISKNPQQSLVQFQHGSVGIANVDVLIESSLNSLNILIEEQFQIKKLLQKDEFERNLRIRAYTKESARGSGAPHKEISLGQVVTFTEQTSILDLCGEDPDNDLQSRKERKVMLVSAIQDVSCHVDQNAIYCFGVELKEDNDLAPCSQALRIWTKTENVMWHKLDQSTRRAAATVWDVTEKRVKLCSLDDRGSRSFCLLLPMDGYPLRMA